MLSLCVYYDIYDKNTSAYRAFIFKVILLHLKDIRRWDLNTRIGDVETGGTNLLFCIHDKLMF